MPKSNKLKTQVVATLSSIRNEAYKFQGSMRNAEDSATAILKLQPNFLTLDAKSEALEEVKAGFTMRFNEWYGDKYNHLYAMKDGKMQIVDKAYFDSVKKGTPKYDIKITTIASFSQQKYTSLKTSEPYLYELAKPIRDTLRDHVKQGLKNLKLAMERVQDKASGKARGRKVVNINEYWNNQILDGKARIKTAESRGDDTLSAEFKKKYLSWLDDGARLVKAYYTKPVSKK